MSQSAKALQAMLKEGISMREAAERYGISVQSVSKMKNNPSKKSLIEQEITRLRAENEELRKDAERYRWLRVQTKPEDFYSGAPAWEVSYQANGMGQVMRDEKLDYAIDAALAAKEKS